MSFVVGFWIGVLFVGFIVSVLGALGAFDIGPDEYFKRYPNKKYWVGPEGQLIINPTHVERILREHQRRMYGHD